MMAHLSRKEKEELLRLVKSEALKKDMQILRKNSCEFIKIPDYFDKYIKFLGFANKFWGHKRKRFKKIKGDNFLI